MNNPKNTFKASTKICYEEGTENNPYLAKALYLSGYSLEELAGKVSYVDCIFLLFTGELPESAENRLLLNALMVQLALPSPRHPASRAAMNAGVCKANAEHLLPISLLSLGGEQAGALEVEKAYRFISQSLDSSPGEILSELLDNWDSSSQRHLSPGFGQTYGEIDVMSLKFFEQLYSIKPEGKTLKWAKNYCDLLNEQQVGILDVGIAACVFHELKFGARESVGLYQLLRAPGLLAYAMEQTHKPVSAIPMLEDSQYELVEE